MAKKLINTYVFTPGIAGLGNVQVPGRWDLSRFLVITNTTRNIIIYNFADPTTSGTALFTAGNNANFPFQTPDSDGYTTFTFPGANTSSHLPGDILQIFVDVPEQTIRPWPFGTDAIERMRVASPQSMLDADFEYGLQPTKWLTVSQMRGYPSTFEIPGTDTQVTGVTTDASAPYGYAGASLITVTTATAHGFTALTPVNIKGLLNTVPFFSRAEGSFLVYSVPTSTSFTYYSKNKVGVNNGDSLLTGIVQLRKEGFYTAASIGSSGPSVTYTNGAGVAGYALITLTLSYPHGLVPGSSILVTITSDNGSNNHNLANGSFWVEQINSNNSVSYTARDTGTITGTILASNVYARPDCYYMHRPLDGGVALGTGGPAHGAHAIRQSKKYIRYQSGKGIMYNTGALFSPNYDIRSITSTGTSIGSTITIVTDNLDHGLQTGAIINVAGISTSGYNGSYTIASITDERTITVTANQVLALTTGALGNPSTLNTIGWHGSTVRAGTFDDQNGMYWMYDGLYMYVGRRTSTFQIAGTMSVTPDSNSIVGTGTRFQDQLKTGDRVVIKGMTHIVSYVQSQTQMYLTPDYRGATAYTGVIGAIVKDIIVPQFQWNVDRCDGSGSTFNPSGYNLIPYKMQMIGMQWSWYGAGFIEFFLRGPEGKFILVHRMKQSNVNNEAYMRSGNQPVRYEVINEGVRTALVNAIGPSDSSLTITLADAFRFPPAGTLYIDNELITYTSVSTSTGVLSGLVRAATLTNFAAGITRSYTSMPAASHSANAGVILVSITATPQISHWGSAFMTDGNFDQDRGYIFNFQQTNVIATPVRTAAFAIRLAPSVSNGQAGDLGDRELINRAQLLLQTIEITAGTAGTNSAFVVEGVLNPQNFNSATWTSLYSSNNALSTPGGQPSFAQVTAGTSITWNNAINYTYAATATTSSGNTVTISTGNATTLQSYITGNPTAYIYLYNSTSAGSILSNTYITQVNTSTGVVTLSQPIASTVTSGNSLVFQGNTFAVPGETIFSFISSPSNKDSLDLSQLKELTNTPIGGRGAFPNGPDILVVNVYITSATAIANLVIRWGEAQA